MGEGTKDRKPQAGPFVGKAAQAMALWAGASQKALEDAVALSTRGATESVRLYGELQSAAISAAKAGWEYAEKIQQTFTGLVTDVKELYTSADE